MTTMIIKHSFRSAFTRPVFLILLVIALLMAPASAFASGDDSIVDDSSQAADQTEPADQFESQTVLEQDTTANSGDVDADLPEAAPSPSQPDEQPEPVEVSPNAQTETADTDTGLNDNNNIGGEQEFAPLETVGTAENDYPAGEAKSTTLYFQVQEVSMSPLLNPGSIIEIVSETYADGDMVVAQKSDGTYVVKVLNGDQLVPLGAGESYDAVDVTILGAATMSSLTTDDLELSGLSWSTVLAQTAIKPDLGDGSIDNPYQIASLENLYWITTNPGEWGTDKHYIQTANIDASATSGWDDGDEGVAEGWLPIGYSGAFHGKYNSNDFTISNLYINRPFEDKIGLFSFTGSSAVLQNIQLENLNITGKQYVGGLVGINNGTIENSSASGTIAGRFDKVGGLVGENFGELSNSHAAVKVTGSNSYYGGLVGRNRGTGVIENCYATGSVTGYLNIGGLVGYNQSEVNEYGSISNSYATGNVIGKDYVGGLVGINYGIIESSSASGDVTGYYDSGYAGGLVGANYEIISNSCASGTVTGTDYVGGLVGKSDDTVSNSYATGNVTGEYYVGGLVGYNDGGEVSNCYATGTVSGSYQVGGLVGKNNGAVESCYAAGLVSGNTESGRLVGYNYSSISNSYWNTDVAGSLPGVGSGDDGAAGKTTAEIQTIAFHQTTLLWDIVGKDGSYPVLGWQVTWKDNIWYMGTPPVDDGTDGGSDFGGDFGFYDFDFANELLTQLSTSLTTVTGQSNAVITPGIIAYGSWNDFYQASAAYQVALENLESNKAALSPVKLALIEVELAIARAAIMAMEARLLAAEGLPYNLAALQAAYAAAVASLNAHQSSLSAGQLAAANQLLAAITGVIAALQPINA